MLKRSLFVVAALLLAPAPSQAHIDVDFALATYVQGQLRLLCLLHREGSISTQTAKRVAAEAISRTRKSEVELGKPRSIADQSIWLLKQKQYDCARFLELVNE